MCVLCYKNKLFKIKLQDFINKFEIFYSDRFQKQIFKKKEHYSIILAITY